MLMDGSELLSVRYPDLDLIKQAELVAGGRGILCGGIHPLFIERRGLLRRASSTIKRVFAADLLQMQRAKPLDKTDE
jgi:hypothetical protein